MSGFAIDSAPAAAALAVPLQPKPKSAAEAAKQFEALLIAQMLRSAREATASEDDSTAETMFDVAGQQFARVLADRGGLGLAKLIARGLDSATAAKNPPAGRD